MTKVLVLFAALSFGFLAFAQEPTATAFGKKVRLELSTNSLEIEGAAAVKLPFYLGGGEFEKINEISLGTRRFIGLEIWRRPAGTSRVTRRLYCVFYELQSDSLEELGAVLIYQVTHLKTALEPRVDVSRKKCNLKLEGDKVLFDESGSPNRP
jgi:hypothetical protein